ncbi:hypothetical protein SPHV1_2350027 [Novosphingobium sp. KN65.2]|nr:hypothetical protein SPHV1_2350027 [Novosphingobium sp. KN65.2]
MTSNGSVRTNNNPEKHLAVDREIFIICPSCKLLLCRLIDFRTFATHAPIPSSPIEIAMICAGNFFQPIVR